jgi:hypothetical protein
MRGHVNHTGKQDVGDYFHLLLLLMSSFYLNDEIDYEEGIAHRVGVVRHLNK